MILRSASKRPSRRWLTVVKSHHWVITLMLVAPAVCSENPSADSEKYFETHVRPILIERCQECHGPDEQSGLLRLDRIPDLNRASGSGPVVVPGQPEQSLLLHAIRYSDSSLQMPPDGKLPEEEIAVLSQWIANGAYWPEEDETDSGLNGVRTPIERIDEMRESHWAYRPILAVEPPVVSETNWTQQPIDQFIIEKLERSGLDHNPMADRRTLILRAYFTLIGLPPSYEEIQEFVSDSSEDSFSRLVDRLLESPHYGERWARHWLDLARFAETTGYLAGSVDTTYPYAYTYRDYVINAFNIDKPFDQFIVEQIAADHLEITDQNREAQAALGFLTVGRKFMNRTHDIIDDRIDVVTRGFLAQSVACARCHDHKYDPIPIQDYYSLYGVFASCHEPSELPLLGNPEDSPQYPEYLEARNKKQQEVDEWLEKKRRSTEEELRSRVADYLVYLATTLPGSEAGDVQQKGRRGVLRPPAIDRWQKYVAQFSDQPHPVWSLWHRLVGLDSSQFSQFVQVHLSTTGVESIASELADGELAAAETSEFNRGLVEHLRSKPPTSMIEAAESIGDFIESIFAAWKESEKESVDEGAGDDSAEEVRQFLFASDSPTTLDSAQILGHLNQAERDEYNRQLSKIKAVDSKHPGAPGKAMVLLDNAKPHEPVVFLRGQPGNRGEPVSRRFLQVLTHVDGGQPFRNGSGRLELARAIASPDNPLTSRVIVNRIWQHHFGVGLVRTSSDFGSRGESPSHPELLDYLAAEFMADGWSIKRLQKRIMLSATWQQSSQTRAEALLVDPENRLLWHFPRRRLEFEPLRDRVLKVSGRLDLAIGGRSVAVHQDGLRRGLYAYVDREDVPSLLASFDVPSPDASQAIRSRTTVPQQALFMINSTFMLDQAKSLAELTRSSQLHSSPHLVGVGQESSDSEEFDSKESTTVKTEETDDGEILSRIIALYRSALAREPDQQELDLAFEFIRIGLRSALGEPQVGADEPQEGQSESLASSVHELRVTPGDPKLDGSVDPWMQLAQMLLACNEFAFVD